MAWERINYPQKSALRIIRRYNHMNVIHPSQTSRIPADWLSSYDALGIHLNTLSTSQPNYRWDQIVENWVQEGRVRDWYLLCYEDGKTPGNPNLGESEVIRSFRLNRYLGFTDYIYRKRRYLVWRIALRALDEVADLVIF